MLKEGAKEASGDLPRGVASKEATGRSEGMELGTEGFGGFANAEDEFCIGKASMEGGAPGSEGGIFREEATTFTAGIEVAADAGFVEIKEAVAPVGGEGIEGRHLSEVGGIGKGEQEDEATGCGQEP